MNYRSVGLTDMLNDAADRAQYKQEQALSKLQAKEAASIEKDCEKLVAKLIKTTAANAKKGRMLTVVGVASRRSVWGTTNFAHMHRALERLKQIGLRATCWSTRDKQVAWRVDAAYEYCIVVDLGTH